MKYLVCVALVVACTNPNANNETLSGEWEGSAGDVVVSLDVTQRGNTLSGEGSLSITLPAPRTLAVTVLGGQNGETINMVWRLAIGSDVYFSGTRDGDTLRGVANGSPFVTDSVTLHRR